MTPIVGLVRPPPPYKPDPVEVAEVFEVPLDFILDKRNHQWRSRELRGRNATSGRSLISSQYLGRDRGYAGQPRRSTRRLKDGAGDGTGLPHHHRAAAAADRALRGVARLVGKQINVPAVWIWLAVAGLALASAMLVLVSVDFGAPKEGQYVPPHVSRAAPSCPAVSNSKPRAPR